MRSGATGLTLTKANKVFIVDPSINAGTELQAINRCGIQLQVRQQSHPFFSSFLFRRCHRIGQTRPVDVYYLVMENSVEQMITRMHNMSGVYYQDTDPDAEVCFLYLFAFWCVVVCECVFF